MPSTYSNLKLQLMATGENTLTWGNVTNINLGTALEEAIAGSGDATFASADLTLTWVDTNASQTARSLRLRLTGTTGGAPRNLIVPSIEKAYIVKNDCADTVTVKTAAGSGIAVPPGKTMWLYNDGLNVVDAVTHLSSLTLVSALPVASGGTGQTSFTDGQLLIGNSSGNTLSKATLTAGTGISITNSPGGITIAATSAGGVTSVSGTGSVNGITLTGTVTGTGNITLGGALTGINLQSQVTGVLPVANGGTGATTLSGYLVGNGTGAITATPTIPGTAITGGFNASAITAGIIDFARLGMAQDQSTNGYVTLPSGGAFPTIIQWGSVSRTNEGAVSATFPIAFPNACLAAVACARNPTSNSDFDIFAQVVSISTTTINIYMNRVASETGTFGAYWIAVGY